MIKTIRHTKSQLCDWESSDSFPIVQRLKRKGRFAVRSTLTISKLTPFTEALQIIDSYNRSYTCRMGQGGQKSQKFGQN